MFGFIYVTTNKVNGKKYVGQCKYGKPDTDRYLGSGKEMRQAIKKYGAENFEREVIQECDSRQALNEAEIAFIAEHNCVESRDWYNVSPGGYITNGFEGKKHSAETREKMRTCYKGTFTEEGLKKIGEAARRDKRNLIATYSRTDETFKKISDSHKGLKTLIKDGRRKFAHPGSDKWNNLVAESWVPLETL